MDRVASRFEPWPRSPYDVLEQEILLSQSLSSGKFNARGDYSAAEQHLIQTGVEINKAP